MYNVHESIEKFTYNIKLSINLETTATYVPYGASFVDSLFCIVSSN